MSWYDISRISSLSASFVIVVLESGDIVLSDCLESGWSHDLGVCCALHAEFSLIWE